MTVFTLATNDQSIAYLAQIFGQVGNVLPIPSAGAPLILSIMAKTINTVALVLGTLMVVYITVIGVLATAHEGEFMGKKWSGLWVPIRMVFGIVGLFPTATGYCALQIVMMWIIVQGVAAADTLWTTVLNYVAVAGNPASNVKMPMGGLTLDNDMQTLFQALTCQATAKLTYRDTIPNGQNNPYYFCGNTSNASNAFCTSSTILDISSNGGKGAYSDSQNPTAKAYQIGPNGSCGTLVYADPSRECTNPSLKCAAATAQAAGFQSIVTTLGAIAAQFAEADHDYIVFYNTVSPSPTDWIKQYCTSKGLSAANCCYQKYSVPNFPASPTVYCGSDPKSPPDSIFPDVTKRGGSAPPDYYNVNPDAITNIYYPFYFAPLNYKDFIKASANQYTQSMASGIANYIQTLPPQTGPGWIADAQSFGWIFAGGYYYKIAGTERANVDDATPFYAINPPANTSIPPGEPLSTYRNNYSSVKTLLTQIATAAAASGGSRSNTAYPSSTPSEIGSLTSNVQSSLLASFQKSISSGSQNPLISIAAFGYGLMVGAQVLYAACLTIAIVLLATGSVNFLALGTGLTKSPAENVVWAMFFFMGPLLAALIAGMYSMGAVLGIYVPLIPYIIFTMGAVGWFIATIEAMVAAPIVALGILSPAGHHEILGRAEPAVMMILNLFLRPTLMVFGMIAAMLVSIVVVKMINAGFLPVAENIISSPGLFEELIFIGAYTSLIVTALNKTFSLIHVVPERVLTWIGGQAVQYGEQEALGETKRGAEGAASSAAGAGKAASGSTTGQLAKGSQAVRKANEDKGKLATSKLR